MARKDASSRIVAGAITIVGLGSVWMAIITSLPSQEELSASDTAGSAQTVVQTPAPAPVRTAAASTPPSAEPVLDLSIPGLAPPEPQSSGQSYEQDEPDRSNKAMAGSGRPDPRTAQVIRLKCEAEIEQLCPDAADGPGRVRCLERRAKDLPLLCQDRLRERFVKWKEDRGRMMTACGEDVRRLCATIRPRDGRVMQCLQEHAQEVSDRCYQTLPKGTLLFRQQ